MNGRLLMAEKRIELGRIINSDYLEINLILKHIPEERKYNHPSQAPRQYNEVTPGRRGYGWPHYDTGRTNQQTQGKATVEVNSVITNIRTRPV